MNYMFWEPAIKIDSVIELVGIVVTIVIAVIGGVYGIITSTKKYELTESYRKELLDWYSAVTGVMVRIIHCIESGEFFEEGFASQKTELMSRLSSEIEVGRFYIPNVIKGDGYGSYKPSAYQGYRNIGLEFLVCFYDFAKNSQGKEFIYYMRAMEKNFTSLMFDIIEPRERIKDYSKYLAMTMPENESVKDYIYKNPKKIRDFLR